MLQILIERGFINPEMMTQYTVDGRNDVFGNLVADTSLRYLMEQLSDFQDEETLLQYHGRQIGGKVDRTPKCHPKMTGKVVEYDWACRKNVYHGLPLKDKRTKAKFREPVSKCLDTDEVLTIKRQRLFSKRAREYMVAYNTLDNQKVDATDEPKGNVHKNPLMSAYLIEKKLKQSGYSGASGHSYTEQTLGLRLEVLRLEVLRLEVLRYSLIFFCIPGYFSVGSVHIVLLSPKIP
jgi:hypothetical protein